MARSTRSSGTACYDPVSVSDWEELAAASSAVELRRLVSKFSVRVRSGASLDTVRNQLARLFPVVPLTAFQSPSVRSFVSALQQSGGIATSRRVHSVAEQGTAQRRVHLSIQRSSAQPAPSRRSQNGTFGTAAVQIPCAAPSPEASTAPVRVPCAGSDIQNQMSSPGLRSASQPALAGQQACTLPPSTALGRTAVAVQDARAADEPSANLTLQTAAVSSQSQQQPGRLLAPSPPPVAAAAADGRPYIAAATVSPASATSTALLPDLLSALSALQQQQVALQQQQSQVASQLTAMTRIVQQLQGTTEPTRGAARSTEAQADVPAATHVNSVTARAPVEPAAAQAVASTGHQQDCPPAQAPSRQAGRDLVFVGLPVPPVIAGRSCFPAHRAVLHFCASQLRIDLRPQDITVRQVFGRIGSRSVVVVRFRSSFVVNSIIVAKSVLLDGRSPVSIEFSRSAAVRHQHSTLRQQRRSAADQHGQEGGAAPSSCQDATVPAILPLHASDQPSPASMPACRSDTPTAAPLPGR